MDLPGGRSLRPARTGAAVFFGIQDWHRLSTAHYTSGVLLRIHWRRRRMADRVLDHLARPPAVPAIDDRGSGRKIQLRHRGPGPVRAGPHCRCSTCHSIDRSPPRNTLYRRLQENWLSCFLWVLWLNVYTARLVKKPTQQIRYVRTKDGVQLAWAEAGAGPVMIKAANWLTHLEYELQSPVWRHWIRFFTDNFRFVRYDERGCGMTDRNVGDLSLERWVEDVEDVVAAAGLHEPFSMLGISQG